MENIVLDMADLNAGVFCCWSVLQQRLEPKNNNNKKQINSTLFFPSVRFCFTK